MSRRRTHRWGNRRYAETGMSDVASAKVPRMTFAFVKLRQGERCVPALEIFAGDYCLLDELPEGMERDLLRGWLNAHGLTEVQPH